MYQLTLQQLFGVNCSQDGQSLTLNKADILLTPNSNNTAESLLIAILVNALKNFQGYVEDENGNTITDENNNPIEFDNRNAYTLLGLFRWNDSLVIRNGQLFVRKTILIQQYEST